MQGLKIFKWFLCNERVLYTVPDSITTYCILMFNQVHYLSRNAGLSRTFCAHELHAPNSITMHISVTISHSEFNELYGH